MRNKRQILPDIKTLRMKAEEQLKARYKEIGDSLKEIDAKKLLYELQVHQIELEMQNEDLREANETAETALKKYTMLYDFAPMGYFTLDSECTILDLNFTGAEMLGEKRFSLVNSNFKLFVSEDSLPVFNRLIKKIYTSKLKESCNVILGYNKKFLCPVYMEGLVTGKDQECLLSVVDISVFKK
jgi:PAS domain-containing protein